MNELFERYGSEVLERLDSSALSSLLSPMGESFEVEAMVDEWQAIGISQGEDIRERFVPSFFFGCEADDPMNAWAFARDHLPHGVQLNTLFGSDIGHFDVRDMAGVLTEAHELVDDGLISAENFRDFVFENPVRFLSRNNRVFFSGTAVESAVAAYWKDTETV